MDNELRREIILDNYQNPNNKGLCNDKCYIKYNANSVSCIDDIDIEVKINNNIIEDIRFDGEACAISTSATSIMINTFIGKTLDEAKNIIENYKKMINEEEYDEKVLEELNVYNEIYKQANRKKCALLPIDAVEKVIDNYLSKK